ncbi:unnamed protein product [Closterium sp. NIES-53]
MRFPPPRRNSVLPDSHPKPPSADGALARSRSLLPNSHSMPPGRHEADAREGMVGGSELAEGRGGHRVHLCHIHDDNETDRCGDTNEGEGDDIFEGIDLDALEAEAWASRSRAGGVGSESRVGGGGRGGGMSECAAISSAREAPSSQHSPAAAAAAAEVAAAVAAAAPPAFPANPAHTAGPVPTPTPTAPPQAASDASHTAFPGITPPRPVAASAKHAAQLKDRWAVVGTPVNSSKMVNCDYESVGMDEVFGDIDLAALEAEALQKSQHKKQRTAGFEAPQNEVFEGIDLDALEADALEQSQRNKRWGAASEGGMVKGSAVLERGVGAGVERSSPLSPQWCAW